jgi:hypothetical protein
MAMTALINKLTSRPFVFFWNVPSQVHESDAVNGKRVAERGCYRLRCPSAQLAYTPDGDLLLDHPTCMISVAGV